MIAISDTPADIRDKVSKIPNKLLIAYAEGATDWEKEKINQFQNNPNYTELAEYYISKIYQDLEPGNLQDFVSQKISLSAKFPDASVNATLSSVIAGTAIAESNSDAKRKISEGVYIDDKIFNNPFEPIGNIIGNKNEITISLKKKGRKIKIEK